MNIKQRLSNLKEKTLNPSIKIKEEYNVAPFFKKDCEVEKIIVKAFNCSKNFILLCDKGCDKELICSYISNFINKKENVEIIRNAAEELKYSFVSKVILTNPDIKDIINVLKISISEFKTFVFTINAKQYKNFLNVLNMLISIEMPSLKNENVECLIGSSEACVVFFSIDEDGLCFVKNIGEIIYDNQVLSLKNIYEYSENIKIETDFDADLIENVAQDEIQPSSNIEAEVEIVNVGLTEEEKLTIKEIEQNIQVEQQEEVSDNVIVLADDEVIQQVEEVQEEDAYQLDTVQQVEENQQIIEKQQSEEIEKNYEFNQNEEINVEIKKENKYKLLKEKVRKKRLQN